MTPRSPHDEAADAVQEGRAVEAIHARGGGKGRPVLTILLASLSLVTICLALIYAFSAGPLAATNANDGDQVVDVEAFDGTSSVAPSTGRAEPSR